MSTQPATISLICIDLHKLVEQAVSQLENPHERLLLNLWLYTAQASRPVQIDLLSVITLPDVLRAKQETNHDLLQT